MRCLFGAWIALVSMFPCGVALALQDDVALFHPSPARLFRKATKPVDGLTSAYGKIGLAVYPVGETHRWHGRVMGGLALLSVGERFVLGAKLSVETVADDRNNIYFRLVRFYYEASLAGHWRFGPGFFSLGYRHRCSHGADDAVVGRILIRSGLSLGYRAEFRFGSLRLRMFGGVDVTLVGQNTDTDFHPRFVLQTSFQLRWAFHKRLALQLGGGLGLFLAGNTPENQNWHIGSPFGRLQALPAPAVAAGLAVLSRVELQVLAHYQRIVDTGLGRSRTPADLFSIRVSFVW